MISPRDALLDPEGDFDPNLDGTLEHARKYFKLIPPGMEELDKDFQIAIGNIRNLQELSGLSNANQMLLGDDDGKACLCFTHSIFGKQVSILYTQLKVILTTEFLSFTIE